MDEVIENMELPINIREFVGPMLGLECCRQRIWKPKSLWFGFGEKLYHSNKDLIDAYYGEWEIGTYYGEWRILQNNQLLCASGDSTITVDELGEILKQINFGRIVSLKQTTNFSVRTEFDSGIVVDFLSPPDEDDECFGILNGSAHVAVEFSKANGWSIGRSDQPWRPAE